MRIYLAVLTLLVALSFSVWAFEFIDQWGIRAQPDGTTFEVHFYGDKMFVDGYVIVRGSGGWYYYAELDARGEYAASPYKVGIDDPAATGIPKNLQRSAIRQAEIDAVMITRFFPWLLTQPDGTSFFAYWDSEVPADGYVIAISLDYEEDSSGYSVCVNCDAIPIDVRIGDPASAGLYYVINYNGGDPFWAFVYDDESGWYYYADCLSYERNNCRLDAQGEYVASPYKVGIDLPPGYNPPTAIQESSWGAVKHRFHK